MLALREAKATKEELLWDRQGPPWKKELEEEEKEEEDMEERGLHGARATQNTGATSPPFALGKMVLE